MKCKDCFYCNLRKYDKEEDMKLYICRKNSPSGKGWCYGFKGRYSLMCYFPIVDLEDWCGEFKEKKEG